ncbi:MAG: DUF4142 domain-containing protein [Rubrivivax sp.]|nr:DUF4142 domain-containing protein [Pyrinomonadaceae bacterium]
MKKSVTVIANLALVAACALLAFVAAASGVSSVQNTNSSATQGNANEHAGMNHGSKKMAADQKFAMEAAMGGMMEVELGRMAAQKGASDEVRQFGQRMVDDHTKAGDELKRIAEGKGMVLPTAPDPKHQMEMQKFSALSGEKFDKEYVKMMIKDRKKAVALFQKEASGGMDAELKSFASSTLPTLQEHWQMIQRINDKMMLRKSGNLKDTNTNSNM